MLAVDVMMMDCIGRGSDHVMGVLWHWNRLKLTDDACSCSVGLVGKRQQVFFQTRRASRFRSQDTVHGLATWALWHKSMQLGTGIDPANVLSVYQMLFAFFCTVSRHY